METPETILQFWFGTQSDDAIVAAEKSKRWWTKDAATDAGMLQQFADVVELAAGGALAAWQTAPRTRLALILLTDQFPRNMYRDSARSFAYDGLARAWCSEGLTIGCDQLLRPIERVFFYLPLEHSESLADQERAVDLFARLLHAVPPEQQSVFAGFHDFAVRHHAVIQRFGRFPHRNAILGRPSSDDELVFLREKGSSF